jgi:ectoine hydroxylase-related dioxygenase (phytanoyl-CoA dioxygenase family)
MKSEEINKLKTEGFVILKDLVPEKWISKLTYELENSFSKHKKTQIDNNSDIYTDGVALHIIMDSDVYIDFLRFLIEVGLVESLAKNFFGANCILNSLSGLNNLPNQPNFSATIHRDLRFYTHGLPVMANCLLMIDDFTYENGGTYLLPFSHKEESKPSEEYFFKNAIQVTGKKGDLLIFDSNIWHCSAPNKTNVGRRAIPLTVSRSFLKPLLDYPRALGYNRMDEFEYSLQQFLGYHSRVPASIDEWYQSYEKRFYKKNQD